MPYSSEGKLTGSASIAIAFGPTAVGILQRVVTSDAETTVIEVTVPEVTSPRTVDVTVTMAPDRFAPATAVTFPFTFFDAKLALSCTSTNCEGPAEHGTAFEVIMSDFPLSDAMPALDQISVLFGKTSASSAMIVSTDHVATVLLVEPPEVA